MRILTFALPCFALALAACGSNKLCTLLGCESGVRLEREIVTTPADVAKLTLTICRNGECASGKFASSAGGAQACSLSGPLKVTLCSLSQPQKGGAFSLTAQLPAPSPKDGDEYTFKIVNDDTGAALLEVKKNVSYTTTQPNGPDCEPTCTTATL